MLLAEGGARAQPPRAHGVQGCTATPRNGTGAPKESPSLLNRSYQLLKLFSCFYHKKEFFPLLVFPFYFTVSSKLSPGKPDHSPAGYAENHGDAVNRETALRFPLTVLPTELSYSDILFDEK